MLLCPLNIDSPKFLNYFEDKVGYYNESLIVLWRGLFD